jgi:Histidine kinase-, DNA gyrase B-, and HSP90-like ATPase
LVTARVELAPEIVPLLSAQLYQSPLKAIEELVVNSYDADARNCYVSIGPETIAVVDDGIGMDLSALKNLWNVGRSAKRTDQRYLKLVKRTQIGKFGIGKLAAYAIAETISYYTRSGPDILHSTLSFKQFEAGARQVDVVIFRLSATDAKAPELINSLVDKTSAQKKMLEGKSWTVSLLTELRPKAAQLSIGRLHWVLSTAMPIVEGFTLYLQGSEVKSAKETHPAVVSFDAKQLPKERYEGLAKKLKTTFELVDDMVVTPALKSGVRFKAEVFPNTISTGKSVDLLRSHGFFVRVRDRLINENDELFGVTPLSYKTWNRFRGVFYADDLDEELTASREGVEESTAVLHLKELASAVFYEARSRFESWEEKTFQAERAKKEIGRNPVSPRLVEIPVADTVSRFGTEKSGADADSAWFYISFGDEEEADLLSTL